jgi:predicted transcriptional regulator
MTISEVHEEVSGQGKYRWRGHTKGRFEADPRIRSHIDDRRSDRVPLTLRFETDRDDLVFASQQVVKMLRASTLDFRTIDSLARESGIEADLVREAIQGLLDSGQARRPIGRRWRDLDWYRLTEKGLTSAEKWNRFRGAIGRDAI